MRVLSFLVLVAVASRGASAELGTGRPPTADSGMPEAADPWDGTQGSGDGGLRLLGGRAETVVKDIVPGRGYRLVRRAPGREPAPLGRTLRGETGARS